MNQRSIAEALKNHWGLLGAFAVSTLAYAALVWVDRLYGTLRGPYTPETIRWYLLAFAAFLGAILWAERRSVSLRWIWIGAVLFRTLLLFTTPSLSDDIYRYLWDGHVGVNGVSPFAYAIDDPKLDYLAVPVREQANNTWMASPYMPVAQWIFTGLAFLFPLEPIYLQILMMGFDLLGGLVLAVLLRMAALPAHRLLIYLWNPLVVVEVAHGAHIDAWMVLLTLASLWFTLQAVQPTLSPASRWAAVAPPLLLALATQTKILPLLLLPIVFFFWSWRQRVYYVLFVVGLALPAGLRAGWGLTGPLDGQGLFGALRIYSERWKFNSGIFHWLETWLRGQGLNDPTDTSKLVMAVLMAGIWFGVWVWMRRRPGIRSTLRAAGVPFIAYTALTPTLHPWYILILLVFLPFFPSGREEPPWLWLAGLPWLYFSGSLIFSYLTYIDPNKFGELEWVRNLEWLPTLGLLLIFFSAAAISWIQGRQWT
jgi:hypothetical protein